MTNTVVHNETLALLTFAWLRIIVNGIYTILVAIVLHAVVHFSWIIQVLCSRLVRLDASVLVLRFHRLRVTRLIVATSSANTFFKHHILFDLWFSWLLFLFYLFPISIISTFLFWLVGFQLNLWLFKGRSDYIVCVGRSFGKKCSVICIDRHK